MTPYKRHSYLSFIRSALSGLSLTLLATAVFAQSLESGLIESQRNQDLSLATPKQLSAQKVSTKAVRKNRKTGDFIASLIVKSELAVRHKTKLESNPFVKLEGGRKVQVYFSLHDTSEDQLRSLENQGVDIEVVNTNLNKVQAWVDINAIDRLSKSSNVKRVTVPSYGRPRAGSFNTQGDGLSRSNALRSLGHRGKGIKVGVVSDGSSHWQTARASGDLPNNVTRYGSCSTGVDNPASCRSARTCNEGTAMAEIIHDLAPEAELAISAVGTSLEFIQQINLLANDFDADIIVDDLGFFGEPYFEDGDIAKAVAALPARVLYISSAGNASYIHYERNYTAMSPTNNAHDFGAQEGSGADDFMGFYVSPNKGTFVLLQWDDPYENANSDYDLYILDSNGNSAGSSTSGGPYAIEGVCAYAPNTSSNSVFFAQVDRFSGANRRLEMFFLGSPAIEYPIYQGSVFGHSGVKRTLAIGAINAQEPGLNKIAFYSSRGPSQVRHPNIENRAKPDLVSIDGVSVSGAGGFPQTFYGTSAAAPHVAGIAAQLMSVSPLVSAKNVNDALTRGAIDLGSAGFDSTYGFGRVDAINALNKLRYSAPTGPLSILLLDDD